MQQYVITEVRGMEILKTNGIKYQMINSMQHFAIFVWCIKNICVKYNQYHITFLQEKYECSNHISTKSLRYPCAIKWTTQFRL